MPGDLVRLESGGGVVADGTLVETAGLTLDESILTGESRPAARAVGDEIRSGSFAVEGAGAFVVTAVGPDSYAQRIAGEARRFRHPRSPLERSLNRLLLVLVAVMIPLGTIFIYALTQRDDSRHEAVTTAVAGIVTLVPEGLILLASLTFAAAALSLARRGALAQQLNAIESLASVDTLCVDKTGTLTAGRTARRLGRARGRRGSRRGAARAGALRRQLAGAQPDARGDRGRDAARRRRRRTSTCRSRRRAAGAACASARPRTCWARRSASRSARSPRRSRASRRPAGACVAFGDRARGHSSRTTARPRGCARSGSSSSPRTCARTRARRWRSSARKASRSASSPATRPPRWPRSPRTRESRSAIAWPTAAEAGSCRSTRS